MFGPQEGRSQLRCSVEHTEGASEKLPHEGFSDALPLVFYSLFHSPLLPMSNTTSEPFSADGFAFSDYERDAAREVEGWVSGDASMLSKALRVAARPFEWAAERPEAENLVEDVNEAIASFLGSLTKGATWTYDEEKVLERACDEKDLSATTLTDLRNRPMPDLDDLARSYFDENAMISAIEGGGTGLGGVAMIAADVPALFTINLRLIQQVAASYGFRLEGPEARPLVVRIFSAAAADTTEARRDALAEMQAAGSALAKGNAPAAAPSAGHVGLTGGEGTDASAGATTGEEGTATAENQSRVMINELARNIAARQLAQLVPLAGAATGAGMNYWFTTATAETAYMLSRALFLEHKRQQQ